MDLFVAAFFGNDVAALLDLDTRGNLVQSHALPDSPFSPRDICITLWKQDPTGRVLSEWGLYAYAGCVDTHS
jgi:hypothetical protein